MTATIIHGNNLDILPTFDDCSIDAIVTDPPYELGFMGKRWDASGIAYNVTLWQECLRVLKPGGHLLAFGGTRTYHRMACAIEDAGFEIRDSIHWLYGSGFPKSLDVSKAIDRQRDDRSDIEKVVRWLETKRVQARVTRKQVEEHFGTINIGQSLFTITPGSLPRVATWDQWLELKSLLGFGDEMDAEVWRLNGRKGQPGEAWAEREIIGKREVPVGHSFAGPTYGGDSSNTEVDITAPATEQAKQWAGWGTALKPAHEPIVVARKPLIGTVAANVLEFGTGAINIDTSRIAGDMSGGVWGSSNKTVNTDRKFNSSPDMGEYRSEQNPAGRWPANVIIDDTIASSHDDWPRYFYCAKPSRKERNAGLDHLDEKTAGEATDRQDGTAGLESPRAGAGRTGGAKNYHPTVKPLALMRYLVRLVTPPGGTILDPFAGSGTTLMAAILEGFNAIGIEMTDEYLPIIQGRIAWAEQQAANQTESDQQELDL